MPSIEFSVYCSCGEGLCSTTEVSHNQYGEPHVTIEPCEKCLEKAKDEGDTEGYERRCDEEEGEKE